MKKGFLFVSVLVITAIFLVLTAFLAKIILSANFSFDIHLKERKAFYLAEAGIEYLKVRLKNDINFYTDQKGKGTSFSWLEDTAKGYSEKLGGGDFKVVRIKGQKMAYAIGKIKDKAIVFLRIKFETSPFRIILWERL